MTIRHWLSLLLMPALLAAIPCSIGATDPSSGPADGDLFKGESVDLYFYQNQFFSFDMTVPGDWHPLSSEEFLRVLRKESPGGQFSERNLKDNGQFLLMSISKYRPAQRGPGGEINPNIVLGATALSKLPRIKTGRDHIQWMKSMMKAMGVQPKTDPHPVQLGGIEFWRFDGVLRQEEITYTAYVSTIRRGYALTFQLNAGSKTDITKLDRVLKSLNFE